MIMTDAEIIREYREAKTPLKQIRILADENQCSKAEIVTILRGAGLEVPAVYRERAEAPSAAAKVPHPSPAGDSFPQGKPGTEDGEAEYRPSLPAPKLAGFAERVNDGAVEVIARLLAVSDASPNAEGASLDFQEQVRGVLALVHELRGGSGE